MPGENAYRFRHALIRDAAYTSLAKATRSELHERHATWLEQTLGDQTSEAEEIIGYHLEQATHYRLELGPLDTTTYQLADRARRPPRPWPDGSPSAAATARRRSTCWNAPAHCPPATSAPASHSPPTSATPSPTTATYERADAVLSDAIERASALGDDHNERHARLVRSLLRRFTNPEPLAETLAETRQSMTVFQAAGDDAALARGWCLLACLYCATDAVLMQEAAERAVDHVRRAGNRLSESGVAGTARRRASRRADTRRRGHRHLRAGSSRSSATTRSDSRSSAPTPPTWQPQRAGSPTPGA